MEPIRVFSLCEGCISLMSATKPYTKWTNVALGGIRSLQLVMEILQDVRNRKWRNLDQKFSLLTILVISLFLQVKNSPAKWRVPQVIHHSAIVIFSLIQASVNMHRSCEHFKRKEHDTGALEFIAAGLRVFQAGASLAVLSQEPRRNLILNKSFAHVSTSDVSFKDQNYYQCSFENAKFFESFFLNTHFMNSQFKGSTLTGDWTCCVFENCDFRNAVLRGRMFQVTFKNCLIDHIDLSGLKVEECRMERCKGEGKGLDKFSKAWFT